MKSPDWQYLLIRHSLAAAILCITACANVPQQAVAVPLITSSAAVANTLDIKSDQSVTISTGYSRVIRAGTHWRYIGSIPHGEVYKPIGSTFTVEGANVHEAYLVLKDRLLVGFYLPVEEAVSLLNDSVQLNFTSN